VRDFSHNDKEIGTMTTAAKTKLNRILRLAGSALIAVLLADVGSAVVPRAFVSTTGIDTNPCSAAQPCRSFNQALTVVEPGGEIIVQDSGGYSTGFTITQSVTIDAGGFDASVINTSANDLCTISAGASDTVVLRGISFHGANLSVKGINVTQVGSLYIEHCSISGFGGFTGAGINVKNGGNIFVTDTDVRKCDDGLLAYTGTGGAALNLVAHDSRFSECSNSAVQIGGNGSGGATGSLINCTAAVSGIGFWAISDASPGVRLTLVNCRAIANTNTGVTAVGSPGIATIRMTNCVVTENPTGVDALIGGVIIGTSPGTNLIAGNQAGNATAGTAVSLQ
jgi:hypothetical protein